MKKILPFNINPIIKTFPMYANATSIIQSNASNYLWLYNCFIQISTHKNLYVDYFDFNYRMCPIIRYQTVDMYIVRDFVTDIIDFFIYSIDNGYYLYLEGNVAKLKEYKSQRDKTHDFMVYGYDSERSEFYIADNCDNGLYTSIKCTFEELRACIDLNYERSSVYLGINTQIELLSYNACEWAVIDKTRIKQSILDFLSCTVTSKWYTAHEMWTRERDQQRNYGVSCYHSIHSGIEQASKGMKTVLEPLIRAAYLFDEHKAVMLDRIRTMKDVGLLCDLSMLEQRFENLRKKSRIATMLLYKAHISPVNIDKLHSNYRDIENVERSLLRELCDML